MWETLSLNATGDWYKGEDDDLGNLPNSAKVVNDVILLQLGRTRQDQVPIAALPPTEAVEAKVSLREGSFLRHLKSSI